MRYCRNSSCRSTAISASVRHGCPRRLQYCCQPSISLRLGPERGEPKPLPVLAPAMRIVKVFPAFQEVINRDDSYDHHKGWSLHFHYFLGLLRALPPVLPSLLVASDCPSPSLPCFGSSKISLRTRPSNL